MKRRLRTINRVLSFVLALIMVVTMMPATPANAAELGDEAVQIEENYDDAISTEIVSSDSEVDSEDEEAIVEEVSDETEDSSDEAIEDSSDGIIDDGDLIDSEEIDEVSEDILETIINPVTLTFSSFSDLKHYCIYVVKGANKYTVNDAGKVLTFEKGSKISIGYGYTDYSSGYNVSEFTVNEQPVETSWNADMQSFMADITINEDSVVYMGVKRVNYFTLWETTGSTEPYWLGSRGTYIVPRNSDAIIGTVLDDNNENVVPVIRYSVKIINDLMGKDYSEETYIEDTDEPVKGFSLANDGIKFDPTSDDMLIGKGIEVNATLETGATSTSWLYIRPIPEIFEVEGIVDGTYKIPAGTSTVLPIKIDELFDIKEIILDSTQDENSVYAEIVEDGLYISAEICSVPTVLTLKLDALETVIDVIPTYDAIENAKPEVKYNSKLTSNTRIALDITLPESFPEELKNVGGLGYRIECEAKNPDPDTLQKITGGYMYGICATDVLYDANSKTYYIDVAPDYYTYDGSVEYTCNVSVMLFDVSLDEDYRCVSSSKEPATVEASTRKSNYVTKVGYKKRNTVIIAGQQNVHVATLSVDSVRTFRDSDVGYYYISGADVYSPYNDMPYKVTVRNREVYLSVDSDALYYCSAKSTKAKLVLEIYVGTAKNIQVSIPITIGTKTEKVTVTNVPDEIKKFAGKEVTFTAKGQCGNSYSSDYHTYPSYNQDITWELLDYNKESVSSDLMTINKKGKVTIKKNVMVSDIPEENIYYVRATAKKINEDDEPVYKDQMFSLISVEYTKPVKAIVGDIEESKSSYTWREVFYGGIRFYDQNGDVIPGNQMTYKTSKGLHLLKDGRIDYIEKAGSHYITATSIEGKKSYTFRFKISTSNEYAVAIGTLNNNYCISSKNEDSNSVEFVNDNSLQPITIGVSGEEYGFLNNSKITIKSGGKKNSNYNTPYMSMVSLMPTAKDTVFTVTVGGKTKTYTIHNTVFGYKSPISIAKTEGTIYAGFVYSEYHDQKITYTIADYDKLGLEDGAYVRLGSKRTFSNDYNNSNIDGAVLGTSTPGAYVDFPISSDGKFDVRTNNDWWIDAGKFQFSATVFDKDGNQITNPGTLNVTVKKQPKVSYKPATTYVIDKDTREVKLKTSGTNAEIEYYCTFSLNNNGKLNKFCEYFYVDNNVLKLRDYVELDQIKSSDLKGELFYQTRNKVTGDYIGGKYVKVTVKIK